MAELPDKDWLLSRVGASRASWANAPRPENIDPAGPGEESVWDYPRPPEVRDVVGNVQVSHGGRQIADSATALRVVETAGAPVYFISADDVDLSCLRENDYVTVCEWKGAAQHLDLVLPDGGGVVENAAFTYPDPFDDLGCGFSRIAGRIAFYPSRVDACFVNGEQVTPQPGNYYAGWVTAHIRGPIKGVPGSQDW